MSPWRVLLALGRRCIHGRVGGMERAPVVHMTAQSRLTYERLQVKGLRKVSCGQSTDVFDRLQPVKGLLIFRTASLPSQR